MPEPITVTWPPMLYTDMSGQKWAVSGEHWIEVPDDMTLDRVDEYMVVDERFTPSETVETRTYIIKGRKGYPYTVTDHGGSWTCTCAGFGWRRKCRHIIEAKNANR